MKKEEKKEISIFVSINVMKKGEVIKCDFID